MTIIKKRNSIIEFLLYIYPKLGESHYIRRKHSQLIKFPVALLVIKIFLNPNMQLAHN
jgi:hypothetical protein